MPTVLRWRGYRFYFFSNEGNEPPHIHIDKDGNTIKCWLVPVALARNIGFPQHEVSMLLSKVEEKQKMFVEAWDEYFRS